MTRTRPLQNAFSSGEIDPLLGARADFQRNQTGLARCRGFMPLRQGGFTRAPGTLYRGRVRNDALARRIPFEFSEDDSLSLEFTPGRMRVWRYGRLIESAPGVPYELATPYFAKGIEQLDWAQDRDVVYLADGLIPIQKLSRYALDRWTIEPLILRDGPFRVQNLDESRTIQCSDTRGQIDLTASRDTFADNWKGTLIRFEPTDFTEIPNWVGNVDIESGAKVVYADRVYQAIHPDEVEDTQNGTRDDGGRDLNSGQIPPTHTSGIRKASLNDDILWQFTSDLVGVVRVTRVNSPRSARAQVLKRIPDPCVTDATYRWSEGAWSERYGYPSVIEIADQRLYAANTRDEPRTLWASVLGLHDSFAPGELADDAFSYDLAGKQTQNAIRWLSAGRRGLYIGALGEVYRAFSSASDQVIGPSTFDTDLVANSGASSARPILAHGWPIYLTRGGLRAQEIRYSFETDASKPVELSLPAQHLGSLGFAKIVWQSAPQQMAWIVTLAGDLVAMVHDPDQDVLGWCVLPLAGGAVEDIDVTKSADGRDDVVTLIVRRTTPDGAEIRTVEELADNFRTLIAEQPSEEAVHLFNAVVAQAKNARATFQAPHLDTGTVHAWTNRGSFGPLEVHQGKVTLPDAVTYAVIGLFDETHYAETLDVEAAAKDGSSRGRKRKIEAGSAIDLFRTAGGSIEGIERHFDQPEISTGIEELATDCVDGDCIRAATGTRRLETATGHADAVRWRIRPQGGAPITVLALTTNIVEEDA